MKNIPTKFAPAPYSFLGEFYQTFKKKKINSNSTKKHSRKLKKRVIPNWF